MIRSLKDLTDHTFRARDGDAGRVHDFYFDDRTWTVRYLVADTGRWIPGKLVLLAPQAIESIDWRQRDVHLTLTKEKIENAPEATTEQPVSRQHEERLHGYYGWQPYWLAAPFPTGQSPAITPTPGAVAPQPAEAQSLERADPALRSAQEVLGYDVQCTDDDAGVVWDFAVDDETWEIRYIVVDTKRWLPGRRILVAPAWTVDIDWASNRIHLDVTREQVRDSPEFDPGAAVNRRYEERLYDFYGRPRYWANEEDRRG